MSKSKFKRADIRAVLTDAELRKEDDWIIPAIEAFGRNNCLKGMSTVIFLIASALNHFGYMESDYKPGMIDRLSFPEPESQLKTESSAKIILFPLGKHTH